MNEKLKNLLINDTNVQDFYLPENLKIFSESKYILKLIGKDKRENKLFKNDRLNGLLDVVDTDENIKNQIGLITFIEEDEQSIQNKNTYYLDFKEFCNLFLMFPEFNSAIFITKDNKQKPLFFDKKILLNIYNLLYRNLKIYTPKEMAQAHSVLTRQLIKVIKKDRKIHSAYYEITLDKNDENYAAIDIYISFVHSKDVLSKTTYRLIKNICLQELLTRNIDVYVDQSIVATYVFQKEVEPFYIKKRGIL